MKNIGFITTNKMFAQSFATTIRTRTDLEFSPFLLLNPKQTVLDIEIMEIDIAVVDIVEIAYKSLEVLSDFCRQLRTARPDMRILLLASQDDGVDRKLAMTAVKNREADDFVFYDTSLDYLFAKLVAI